MNSTQPRPPSKTSASRGISFEAVTKRFGSRVALDAVTFEVPRGSIFGLLGHNGAGKSTIIGSILGQVLPDAGTVWVNGSDVLTERSEALSRVGAIYETPAFYQYLSGERNLRIYSEYSGGVDPAQLAETVEMVGLTQRIMDRVGAYSHGMRQRLALAQALLPKPEILILDEPMEGLDPEGIVETRNLISRLHREWGMTILISSHHLGEMERLCSHLAIMREGRLLFSGDWRRAAGQGKRLTVRADRQAEAERGLLEAKLVEWPDHGAGGELRPGIAIPDVAGWLAQHGFRVERIALENETLEDFYLAKLRDAPSAGILESTRDPDQRAAQPAGATEERDAEPGRVWPENAAGQPRFKLLAVAFRNELLKLSGRKRTYLGFVVFALAEMAVVWLWRLPMIIEVRKKTLEYDGLPFDNYSRGLSQAVVMIILTVGLAAGLYLALVAGDLVASEMDDGTIRMVLARPISRPEIFAIKALTGVCYTFALMLFIGFSSLAAGLMDQGRLGDLLVFAPLERVFADYSSSEGLRRYFLAILCMSVTYQAVSALALMCSCLKLRPATAVIVTLSVLYLDFAFNAMPLFAPYKAWFLSHHLSCWVLIFRYAPPWQSIATSMLFLGGLTISFWTVGLSSFCARDIKN